MTTIARHHPAHAARVQDPATIVIKPEPRAIKEARDFVAGVFASWGLQDHLATTVITELATNAVRHGSRAGSADRVVVRAYRRENGVPLVEAWDTSDALPQICNPGPAALSGRGLLMVDQLVRAWGTRPLSEGGKVVWAELDPTPR